MPKKRSQAEQSDGDDNGSAVEMATVAWMMAVMATLVCGAAAVLIRLAVGDRAGAENLLLFAHVLHFGAIVTGLVSLLLMAWCCGPAASCRR